MGWFDKTVSNVTTGIEEVVGDIETKTRQAVKPKIDEFEKTVRLTTQETWRDFKETWLTKREEINTKAKTLPERKVEEKTEVGADEPTEEEKTAAEEMVALFLSMQEADEEAYTIFIEKLRAQHTQPSAKDLLALMKKKRAVIQEKKEKDDTAQDLSEVQNKIAQEMLDELKALNEPKTAVIYTLIVEALIGQKIEPAKPDTRPQARPSLSSSALHLDDNYTVDLTAAKQVTPEEKTTEDN